MRMIVTEDTEIVANGQKVLVEKGDQIIVKKQILIDQLKEKLSKIDKNDTDAREPIIARLYELGVSL